MTTLTPERIALTERIALLCAGHTIPAVLCSLSDVLASSAGFASDDLTAAERLIDALVPDIKADIRRNWDDICRIRASAVDARGRA